MKPSDRRVKPKWTIAALISPASGYSQLFNYERGREGGVSEDPRQSPPHMCRLRLYRTHKKEQCVNHTCFPDTLRHPTPPYPHPTCFFFFLHSPQMTSHRSTYAKVNFINTSPWLFGAATECKNYANGLGGTSSHLLTQTASVLPSSNKAMENWSLPGRFLEEHF